MGAAIGGAGHETRGHGCPEQHPSDLQSCIPQVPHVASPDIHTSPSADSGGDTGQFSSLS